MRQPITMVSKTNMSRVGTPEFPPIGMNTMTLMMATQQIGKIMIPDGHNMLLRLKSSMTLNRTTMKKHGMMSHGTKSQRPQKKPHMLMMRTSTRAAKHSILDVRSVVQNGTQPLHARCQKVPAKDMAKARAKAARASAASERAKARAKASTRDSFTDHMDKVSKDEARATAEKATGHRVSIHPNVAKNNSCDMPEKDFS